MLAYKNDQGEWVSWRPGSRLPSRLTPSSDAEKRMSDAELARHGLFRVAVEPVADGMMAERWTLVDVRGRPVHRPTLVPKPANPTPEAIADDLLEQVSQHQDGLWLGLAALLSLWAESRGLSDLQALHVWRARALDIATRRRRMRQ